QGDSAPTHTREGEEQQFDCEGDGCRDPVDREHERQGEQQGGGELCDGVDGRQSAPAVGAQHGHVVTASKLNSRVASARTKSASWVAATRAEPSSSSSARRATSSCQVRASCPKVG